ncbi:hypothetical protein PENTCL1PPCAC_21857, partial [Pristionchus entomophagus]
SSHRTMLPGWQFFKWPGLGIGAAIGVVYFGLTRWMKNERDERSGSVNESKVPIKIPSIDIQITSPIRINARNESRILINIPSTAIERKAPLYFKLPIMRELGFLHTSELE